MQQLIASKDVSSRGDVAKGGTKLTNVFFKNVDEFVETFDNARKATRAVHEEAFELYKQAKWSELEDLFKANRLNEYNGAYWPPANGGYNITDNVSLTKGMKFDRYQETSKIAGGKPEIGGSYTSPINTSGKPYSYGERALQVAESKNALYYEIEVLKDLPIKGELADVIPWHGQVGGGKQMKFVFDGTVKDFQWLIDRGYLKITIKNSPNGAFNSYIGIIY